METSAPARPGGHAWFSLAIFVILYVVAYLDRQILTLLVDPIRKDLGISDFQISLIQSVAFVASYSLFALPFGWLVDRYSRRGIVFVGVFFWSLAAMAGGLARSFGQLLVARCGVGMGEAALSPAVYSMMSDTFERSRLATALSIYTLGGVIGGALSFIIGAFVIDLLSGSASYTLPLIGVIRPWQATLIVVGMPGLLLALTIFLVREPPRRGSKAQADGHALRRYFIEHRHHYACHFGGFALYALLGAGYNAWMPTHLMRSFGWSVSEVGSLMGTQTIVCGSAGLIGAGLLTDHLFRRGVTDSHLRLYSWGAIVTGVAAVIAVTVDNVALCIAAMSIVKALIPFVGVAAAALQITTPNRFRGQISALFLLVYNVVGYGVGPSLIAAVSDYLLGGAGQIGRAMAWTFIIATPFAFTLLRMGMAPMRHAVATVDQ